MKNAVAAAAAAAATVLCARGEIFMRGAENPPGGERSVLFSSRAGAGVFEGVFEAARAAGGCAALDARGAAMCGRAAPPDGLDFCARSYVARGSGAARGMTILPGAGNDGAAAIFTFEGAKKLPRPAIPADMPDFGFGDPLWSAAIESTRTSFASFRAQCPYEEAFAAACAAYRAQGWSELPGAGGGFAMFARGSALAAVFAEPDGGGSLVCAVQRGAQ